MMVLLQPGLVGRLSEICLLVTVIINLMQCVEADDGTLSQKALIAIVVVAVVLVVAVLLFLIIFFRCRRKRNKKQEYQYEAVAMHPTNKKGKHKQTWEIPFSSLIIGREVVSEGFFGDIVKCSLKNGLKKRTVAVAYLEGEAIISSRDAFHTELDLMKKIGRHPHICSLIATSYNKNESLYVAFDYGINGDLRSFLRVHRLPSDRTNICSLSPARLLHIAIDIAKGMDYLASQDIVHKDLRAKNVIICNGLVAKVAGIGLTKQEPAKSWRHQGKRIMFRWAAIESWSEKVFTTKSDVWSYGVVLWEITTLGGTPYHGISNSNVLQQRLMDGHRLDKPLNCTADVYNLMLLCWQDSPDDRLTFGDLLHDLSKMNDAKHPTMQMFVTFKQDNTFVHSIIDPDKEDD